MTANGPRIRLGAAVYHAPDVAVSGGFVTIDGERHAQIANVDQVAPFLMSIASDSDMWLFVGSNGPFTAGRGSPDTAFIPYQTVDRILRDPATGGARTTLLVCRGEDTALWEPWQDTASVYRISRNLYKRVDGTAVLFEEVNHDLGVRFRWRLSASERFGLIRRSVIEEVAGRSVEIRYLDGWHQVIPPGVDQQTYARLSYLAAAYMRHERLPGVPLAVFSLAAPISDRAEPSESLQVAAAWSIGHRNPIILLSDRQLAVFRRGGDVVAEEEVRGEVGAFLVADQLRLEAGEQHAWYTVGDTRLDHAKVVALRDLLALPDRVAQALESAVSADHAGVRRRVAGADGLQQTADEAASASHFSSVLFNIMRGGSFEHGYEIPRSDLATYLRTQNQVIADRHREWVETLPPGLDLRSLRRAGEALGDPQLNRLVRGYLPLTYSRRHGDPSRPWNRFTIRVRTADGNPVYGYEGNWRDIFQNWEALNVSFPDYLPHSIAVFLNASTADGYNPYRITRSGIDWEVIDPRDPWSHIGYWGDHQIIYLLRLLEGYAAHEPGALEAALGEAAYAYARVPYRIADFRTVLADPRGTIEFDRPLHDSLLAASEALGADGKLVRTQDGEVRLVTLLEKLLVPLLVKLTNFVPGGGIWLNTQRPEWNDANNALAGWGLSVVTLSAIRRYLAFLAGLAVGDRAIPVSRSVADLLERVTRTLGGIRGSLDDAERYRVLVDLGLAGEAHRGAVYAGDFGEPVPTSLAEVRALVAVATRVVEETLRANRRPDTLFHAYNVLHVEGERASIDHLGQMLEGQVAILDSGILDEDEAVELLRALRASEMYRADQHSYLLYPDRTLTPFLERNTIDGRPPIDDPSLFVVDSAGAWHFHAELSTLADLEHRLQLAGATPDVRTAVLELWNTTFAHDEFTGRSGSFFMFEGLGSVYWHMITKLQLAVQGCHSRAVDPRAAAALAEISDDIRNGLGFRKTPEAYGAFPTDPYSHTPSHHGAQQPGMTGHVKEQVLARFGELGADVVDGCLRFRPRLLHVGEFSAVPTRFGWQDVSGSESVCDLPAGSLAFTYCQVAICYSLGDAPSMVLERTDGGREVVHGDELAPDASRAIFERRGTYRRLIVTVPRGQLLDR